MKECILSEYIKHRAKLELSGHLRICTTSNHFPDFSLAFLLLIESETSEQRFEKVLSAVIDEIITWAEKKIPKEVGKISFVFFPLPACFICKIYRVASFEVLKMSSTAKTTLLSSPLLTKDKFKIKTFPYLLILCYLNKTQLNFCHLQPEWKQRLLHEKSLFLLRMIGKLSGRGKRSPFEIVLPAKLEIKSSD